jgi:hypothetical protein
VCSITLRRQGLGSTERGRGGGGGGLTLLCAHVRFVVIAGFLIIVLWAVHLALMVLFLFVWGGGEEGGGEPAEKTTPMPNERDEQPDGAWRKDGSTCAADDRMVLR